MNRWKKRENQEEESGGIGDREVKKRIEEDGSVRWQTGMESKSTLKWYKWK